jgi:tetratricopeptide (TPR) repeat protein
MPLLFPRIFIGLASISTPAKVVICVTVPTGTSTYPRRTLMSSGTQQSATTERSVRKIFDHAVGMSQIQPEAALSIFRQIREEQDGPFSHAAGEQLISTLWTLRRLEECKQEAAQLMDDLKDDPRQSYLWGRVALRWSEAAIADGQEAEAEPVLQQAEEIFLLNADFLSVARVSQLRSAISVSQGKYEKAERQADRAQRLIATHAITSAPETARSLASELVGAGNGNGNN